MLFFIFNFDDFVHKHLQGEKVVPESINRLHEIAREVEDKKQSLLGTTVEAAMSTAGTRNSDSSLDPNTNSQKRTETGKRKLYLRKKSNMRYFSVSSLPSQLFSFLHIFSHT